MLKSALEYEKHTSMDKGMQLNKCVKPVIFMGSTIYLAYLQYT